MIFQAARRTPPPGAGEGGNVGAGGMVQRSETRVPRWEDHGMAAGQVRTKVVLDWHLAHEIAAP